MKILYILFVLFSLCSCIKKIPIDNFDSSRRFIKKKSVKNNAVSFLSTVNVNYVYETNYYRLNDSLNEFITDSINQKLNVIKNQDSLLLLVNSFDINKLCIYKIYQKLFNVHLDYYCMYTLLEDTSQKKGIYAIKEGNYDMCLCFWDGNKITFHFNKYRTAQLNFDKDKRYKFMAYYNDLIEIYMDNCIAYIKGEEKYIAMQKAFYFWFIQ